MRVEVSSFPDAPTFCSRYSFSSLTTMPSDERVTTAKGHFAYEALEAFTQARDRQEEARRFHEHNCEEAGEPETKFNGTVKDTLEKAEALEKHVKKVSTRAEVTEADFFKTLIDRHEEAQNHLNALPAQLSTAVNDAPKVATLAPAAQHHLPFHTLKVAKF